MGRPKSIIVEFDSGGGCISMWLGVCMVTGEAVNRPHSEVKVWTPPEVPPPAAQSAPPELADQAKAQGTFTSYPE